MLLRLKQMLDVKTTEAENTFLSQQRRIEELNEAEEMIVDLRAELRRAQDKLEEVKNNHMQQSNGSPEKENVLYCENTTNEKMLHIYTGLSSFSHCGTGTCCNPEKQTATSSSHFDSFLVDNPNIVSIIMKSKEPELYRNGCTQRIQAIERNLLDGKISSEDVPDQDLCTKNESIINGNEQNLQTCTLSSIEAENADIKNLDGSEVVVRFRRCQSVKPRLPSLASPQCTRISHTDDKMNFEGNSSEREEKSLDNNAKGQCILRRSLRKRKVRYWDGISPLSKSLPNQFEESCQPCPGLSRCKKYSGNHKVSGEL